MNINNANVNPIFNANIDDSQQIFGIVQQCAECYSRVQDISYKYVNRDAAADLNPQVFPELNITQKVLENWIYLLSYAPIGQERLAEMGGAAWGAEFLMINNAQLNDDQKQVIRNSYLAFLGNLLQIPAGAQGGKRRRQRKTRKARK